MNNRFLKVLSQIMLAVGLTLMAGGIASFFFPNVELRFFGNKVFAENDRVIWVIINAIIVLAGLILFQVARKKIGFSEIT